MLTDIEVKEEICWVIVLFSLFLCLFENFHNTKVILRVVILLHEINLRGGQIGNKREKFSFFPSHHCML